MPENWFGGLLTCKTGTLSSRRFCLITCNAYMSADISASFTYLMFVSAMILGLITEELGVREVNKLALLGFCTTPQKHFHTYDYG